MERKSLRPIAGADRAGRGRLGLKDELILALLPTLAVLLVFFFVEEFSHQRLLFASLASSAFLIYLDPEHGTNQARTLIWAQGSAALLGYLFVIILGSGYSAAAIAMTILIVLMVSFDFVHPPAVSTALSFAFGAGKKNHLALFAMALAMVVMLVVLERITLRLLSHLSTKDADGRPSK